MVASDERVRVVVDLEGIVQGVGFRPAVKRMADGLGLGGMIQNRAGVVRLCLEGPRPVVERLLEELPERLPPRARIDRSTRTSEERLPADEESRRFSIVESAGTEETVRVLIPADLRACAPCLTEVLDASDRRYGYPFTTCTDCGPRLTVVTDVPYDRARTTLSRFPLCEACRAEYESPDDRRFHAESIACPACGPSLRLTDAQGRTVGEHPLRDARAALARGQVVAVRGIGGYLLAVNAFDASAVSRLRSRKRRPHKPFAVMARDLGVVRRLCELPDGAAVLLESPTGPITVLELRDSIEGRELPAALLNPDANTLGVMLPTSPLHALLFQPLEGDSTEALDLLVMTSGNRSGEPIAITNEEARERLVDIADVFLAHDRDITIRNDDSIFVAREGEARVWRRARGLAPEALRSPVHTNATVLAMGAALKSSVTVGFEDQLVLSPHIGDLETPEAVDALEAMAERMPRFLGRAPTCVAVDLHPDMASTRLGQTIARSLGVPAVEVQHHHAHAAACLAEHGRTGGLALTFDGLGLGTDGALWGAELLWVDPKGDFRRWATFAAAPLPGGDEAVRRPARQLVGRLIDAGLDDDDAVARVAGVRLDEAQIWRAQIARGLNAPRSHAAGRVFDAFAAVLGIAPDAITYEAQAALRLERAALSATPTDRSVEFSLQTEERNGLLHVRLDHLFRAAVEARPALGDVPRWALAFHRLVAKAAVEMIDFGAARVPAFDRAVALSGGVFQNGLLETLLRAELASRGIEPLFHRAVPANDGGISLGQAVVAALRLA